MKNFFQLFLGIMLIGSLLLSGCGGDGSSSSSPTSVTVSDGVGNIEGQFVADTGTQVAKLRTISNQTVVRSASGVYPVSGATVELLQNGTVIATATTDEYGRFRFINLAPGDYQVRVVVDDGSVAHYNVYVSPDQTITVYGRVISGDCLWDQQLGPHWENMCQGEYWGNGFCGGSPGSGFWHDGQDWCEPIGSGPHHGPHH